MLLKIDAKMVFKQVFISIMATVLNNEPFKPFHPFCYAESSPRNHVVGKLAYSILNSYSLIFLTVLLYHIAFQLVSVLSWSCQYGISSVIYV